MNLEGCERVSPTEWRIPPSGDMRVPAVLYADDTLIKDMDDKVREQLVNVTKLPGIVRAAYAMPDAHWGYGFPIGGVAAFDPQAGGIVSAGGVGFDISCGVRTLLTSVKRAQFEPLRHAVADELARAIPAGMGRGGRLHVSATELTDVLTGGARWAVERGYGEARDLPRIEESGQVLHAKPAYVSTRAYTRQLDEIGTLGSGNHYLEVQVVKRIERPDIAAVLELEPDDIVITIHCGSRGLGHQIGTDYLREMVHAAPGFGIRLPDRELACAPIQSDLGQRYLGAMRAATNCALANRQVLTHLVRQSLARLLPAADIRVLYDVSHNICKEETHTLDGVPRRLFVHRKGATRALGPGDPAIPEPLRAVGQPVLIGGSMGTASFVLVGAATGESRAFSSACHGAGRNMSRTEAARRWRGREVVDQLAERGILIRSRSMRGVAEEAPDAYKSVERVVDAAEAAGLAHKVARLEPLVCVKG
jgi:tRNA-splicing ligase RtcB (3'-phosphate/5'-hydroxy nucleic acid ligase)